MTRICSHKHLFQHHLYVFSITQQHQIQLKFSISLRKAESKKRQWSVCLCVSGGDKTMYPSLLSPISQKLFTLSGNHAHLSFQYGAECTEWTLQSGPCNENVYSSSPSWKKAPLEDSVLLIEMLLKLRACINAGGEASERQKTIVPYIQLLVKTRFFFF